MADSPIAFDKLEVSPRLFAPVNVGAPDEGSELTFASGSATVKDQKFTKLTVNTTQTVPLLSRGDYQISEFFAPSGIKVVQVVGKPAGADPWTWAVKLGQFELTDSAGAKHKPRGGAAKVKGAQGSDRMVAVYDADQDVSDTPREDGRPTDVFIMFLVPEGTSLTELTFEGKRVTTLKQDVS
jgi:hypothetical protein